MAKNSIASNDIVRHPASRFPLKREIIDPLGLTVTHAAEVLGVTRATLSTLLRIDAVATPCALSMNLPLDATVADHEGQGQQRRGALNGKLD